MKNIFFYDTMIGQIGIAENGFGITNIFLHNSKIPDDLQLKETELLKETINQLNDYFAGRRISFNLPLDFQSGTEFEKYVWMYLKTIPYGETRSYKEIAQLVGRVNAFRAVGSACKKNPIAIVIPCHRVIGSDGGLTGYGGGINIKQMLLSLEKKAAVRHNTNHKSCQIKE
jgi:methylated-DNA-[protein]-cysteine S-methyltransferase